MNSQGCSQNLTVIPAKAGIHKKPCVRMDSYLRRNDKMYLSYPQNHSKLISMNRGGC